MSATLAYVNRSLDAAFALVLRDRRAWDKFDLTVEGFYRSFAALFIVMPMNIAMDLLARQVIAAERLRQGEPPLENVYDLGDAVFSTLTLAVQWMIFPVVMIFVLRFLGLAHRYAPLIIAYNWGTIVIYLLNLPAFLLFAAGILDANDTVTLYTIILVFTLYYRYYTAETALDAGWSVAASTALLGLVLHSYYEFFAVPFAADLWLPGTR